jgi:hypothetical protein
VTDDPNEPMRRFARPGGEGTPEADPFLCRHLRAKNWFSPDAFGQGDPTRSPSTSQYWCLRTMRSNGPDGDLVLPEECIDERICFEAMVQKGRDS